MFERMVLKNIDKATSREQVFEILNDAAEEVNASGEDKAIIKRLGIAGYKKVADLSSGREQMDKFDIEHILQFSEGLKAVDALSPTAFYTAVANKAEQDLLAAEEAARQAAAAEAAAKAAASRTGFFGKALKGVAAAAVTGAVLTIGYRAATDGNQ